MARVLSPSFSALLWPSAKVNGVPYQRGYFCLFDPVCGAALPPGQQFQIPRFCLPGCAFMSVKPPFWACLAAGVKPLLLVTSQYVAACALCSSVLESDLEVPFGLRSLVCLGFCKPGLILLLIPQVKPSCVASAVLAPAFLPGLHPFFVLVPMSIGVEHWVLSWSTPPTVVRRGLSGHPGLVAFNALLPALRHADRVLG